MQGLRLLVPVLCASEFGSFWKAQPARIRSPVTPVDDIPEPCCPKSTTFLNAKFSTVNYTLSVPGWIVRAM